MIAQDRMAFVNTRHGLGPRIRLYGLRHLRSSAAADDLLQQVLLTALEALRAGRLREVIALSIACASWRARGRCSS